MTCHNILLRAKLGSALARVLIILTSYLPSATTLYRLRKCIRLFIFKIKIIIIIKSPKLTFVVHLFNIDIIFYCVMLRWVIDFQLFSDTIFIKRFMLWQYKQQLQSIGAGICHSFITPYIISVFFCLCQEN